MSHDEGIALLHARRARLVETVFVNGGCRLNVVLRDGRPQTWVVDRP